MNYYGQCNIPSPNRDFVAVATSPYHSLGLKANGSIVAWGDNSYGRCNIPSPNSGFIAIAAGYDHSLGIKAVDEDINNDGYVDFKDWALLANKWLMDCSGPDWCGGCDLNKSGKVDLDDMEMFTQYWLWE
jgi:hypothetical protein